MDFLTKFSKIYFKFPTNYLPDFQQIAFVCVQHLLFTTLNLMEGLVHLGARPDNIH